MSLKSIVLSCSLLAAAVPSVSVGAQREATPVETLKVADGFKVELLYTVPRDNEGSWVAMTVDDKGRLITSDQYGGLFRITPPPLGEEAPVKVEPIPVDMGHAQGLLYAFDSLYVVVNAEEHGGRGLYRVRDTDGDDMFDQVERLKKFEESGGEHGPHAVILGPDKESIYVVVGDQTALPEYDVSRVPEFWGEDQLLPRIYGRGFMRGVLAPRGWIAKTDPEGKRWAIITTGFRNEYDAAFNLEGELFTYDADMEWDLNTPWYRPTRVCHVVSGAEFGWRNGSGKWPDYYPDSLPAVVNIGPGSPTGVAFGYGAKFPEKYQRAFFICDWSYGKLMAAHLQPKGSTYQAEFEDFISGAPLPLTDLVVNPKDQALYFAIGGRRVQSALYRVTYIGEESTSPVNEGLTADRRAREVRKSLEAYHGVQDPAAVRAAWPSLRSRDRFIRSAARVAIEHQPVDEWKARALRARNKRAALAALLALARVGPQSDQPALLEALGRLDWEYLDLSEKLELLRVYSLAFIRMGEPDENTREQLATKFEGYFPTKNRFLNTELCTLLVYLQAPNTAKKAVPLMLSAPTQEEQIAYARPLRLLKAGWTMDLRKDYFSWFLRAANFRGGASFSKFVEYIKTDAVDGLTPEERTELQPILDAEPEPATPAATLAAMSKLAERGFYKEWTFDELSPKLQAGLDRGRDFERGRAMFGAVGCFSCHRFAEEGGIVGPDLTSVAGRFNPQDLLETIIEPSKEISDQYGSVVITKRDGSTVIGRIANLSGDGFSVITDMYNPGGMTGVRRRDIVSIEDSKVSMMPVGLLNVLQEEEIMDLLAYLLSGGEAEHPMFR